MAYSALNLKRIDGFGGAPTARFSDGQGVWAYRSEDAMSTVRGAGYISDAHSQGMKLNDLVFVTQVNSSGVPQALFVTIVMGMTAGAADLADGTSITVTNT